MYSQAAITAMGSFVPNNKLTNNDLEKIVDTSDDWILQRTGIKERRISDEKEFSSDLSIKAVKNLIEKYKCTIEDVDLIIISTLTPDFKTPSTASIVQAKLGVKHAGAFDLNAACAGFTYGLQVANGLITSGLHKKILVIGVETLSKITDYTDRTTCILFGDGAGAALVEYQNTDSSFIASYTHSKGEAGKYLYASNLSSEMENEGLKNNGCIVQNGREVYKWAVQNIPNGIKQLLAESNKEIKDIDWFIPHSANLRIIEAICERTEISFEKTLQSLEYYGNTSSATIPLALDEALDRGEIKKGDLILLYGFGGGLTQAAQLLQWNL